MAYHVRKSLFCFFVLLFTFLLTMLYEAHGTSTVTPNTRPPFDKRSFPDGFVFGAGTAAYQVVMSVQVEGAANKGGKGPSIWDTFTHAHPEKIWDHSTGDVSIDFYDRYKTDIAMVKEIGLGAFRFSISWSRILPNGKISGGVNKEGVNFYNNVINEVLANGIEPFVTIFHWDVPQALDDEFGGFLSAKIVNYYRDYADLCFKLFGDRVKHWTTLNEPLSFSMNGYVTGTMAPGRCSNFIGNCTKGNSGTEPYIVGHHLLLSHATAVQLYKTKYQKVQKGEIGITLVTHWFMPKSNSTVDLRASHRMLDFFFGWFLHPIVYGDYPSTMKSYVKSRLPTFSEKQSKMLKGSMDFLGVNYYTSNYASPALSANKVNLSYTTDSRVALSTAIDGIPICPPTALNWLFICPSGIHSLMLYIKEKYNNPPIYITENGYADANNSTLPLKEALEDEARIKYFEGHLWYLHKAIQDGVNVKGYFAWSIFDSFEWDAGYTVRFGLNFVDYKDGLKRYTKKSATWFKNFLQKH